MEDGQTDGDSGDLVDKIPIDVDTQLTQIPDLRYGLNKGHPTTVIPKAVRPSNKKGVKT